jgi:conjugative relaxase-like TrwC/TraI family protein
MMSLRGLGNLSSGSGAAKLAATYYQEYSADYYVEDLDHQGQWMGQGAEALGLEGAVDRDEFQLSLAGYVAGHEVKNAGKENRQMGWDLTFSAPKSVSIVWAGADTQHKQEIELAHQRAVGCAFEYLEANTFTRRGAGGATHEDAKLVASRFNHYTSREGDPQVHSHVVVSNFSVREDGTVGTIDSRTFYENKMAAGALYQVELAWQMQKLDYKVEQGIKGTFRLTNVTQEAERVFSKRDKQIDTLSKERGIESYAGTRGIVLATRANKVNCDLSEREETWGQEAREHSVHLNIERDLPDKILVKNDNQILSEVSQKLTVGHSTFKENSLLRETARSSLGSRSGAEVLGLVQEAKGRGYVVSLENGLLTTPDMAKVELDIMARVERMVNYQHYGANDDQVIKNGIPVGEGKKMDFSYEQRVAIRIATQAGGLAVIQGLAGTGKSTMLGAVKECYDREGWKVQGIALSGQAAQNLQKEAGIESKTIASWLPHQKIDSRTVVIIDEAGMVGSRQMADVIQKVEMARAKLILVGDERQLQPIAAGGILHAIDQKVIQIAPGNSAVMKDIWRQREEWMKETVMLAAQGRTGKALDALAQKEKINLYENSSQARTALVDEFITKHRNDFSTGMVLTNISHDAQKINTEIRTKLQEQKIVDEKGIEFDNGSRTIDIAKGDRIIFTRNDYNLDVRNGQRGIVENITSKGIINAVLDDGQTKEINVQKYNHIEYGWATTTHKAQGMTVDRAFVYGFANESMASQQATYVQISRAREETKLFIVAGERGVEREGMSVKMDAQHQEEALKQMKKCWSHNAVKDTTLEHIPKEQKRAIKEELESDLRMEQHLNRSKGRSLGQELGM